MLDVKHNHFMASAIRLAERGLYTTMPNPRVGCVLVKDAQIVGQGWHQKAGEGHAEVNALAAAGELAKGATAYVTLEPCNHHGKTPPCCDALIAAGVSAVVVGMVDPNPLVAGKGIEKLRQAGLDVIVGVLEAQAEGLNPGFNKRMRSGLPYVRCKMAMSLDGRTAMATGESQWITGAAARSDVQRLRARSCAIITGIGSVRQDDASLTVREEELGLEPAENRVASAKQPLRVLLDSNLSIKPNAKLLLGPNKTVIVGADFAVETANRLSSLAHVEVWQLPQSEGRIDLLALLKKLAQQECNEVLIEAGSTLAAAALRANIIDELIIYMAPKLLGSTAKPLFELPIMSMAEGLPLTIADIRAVGDDWRITAIPKAK